MLPISWADAPDDTAGEALYRVKQLEKCFISHFAKTQIRDEFMLCILRELVDSKVITTAHITNAVNHLAVRNQEHIRLDDPDYQPYERIHFDQIVSDVLNDFFPESLDE